MILKSILFYIKRLMTWMVFQKLQKQNQGNNILNHKINKLSIVRICIANFSSRTMIQLHTNRKKIINKISLIQIHLMKRK